MIRACFYSFTSGLAVYLALEIVDVMSTSDNSKLGGVLFAIGTALTTCGATGLVGVAILRSFRPVGSDLEKSNKAKKPTP